MEALFPLHGEGDEPWRCQKHPSAQHPTGGVCPACLRARLLRLCPDCAGERSRGCTCPNTSSFLSSSSFVDVPGSSSVPRVFHPFGGERAFHRSRSAAPRRLVARSEEAATAGGSDGAAPPHAHRGGGSWSWLWPFARAKKAGKGEAKNPAAAAVPATRLPRSRSVGVVVPRAYPPDQGAAHGGGGARSWKGWSRYLPIPVRSFRWTSKVVQSRSPSAVTEENLHLHA